jgi:hypothetical protein
MGGNVARVGQERCVQDLVGRAMGKRTLVRLRRRWEDKSCICLRLDLYMSHVLLLCVSFIFLNVLHV